MAHIRFSENDDNFVESDSEEDLDDEEKKLLKKARGVRAVESDSEEEVLGVASDSSNGESDDQVDDDSDIALSDVEGQELEDDLPDVRAWGKNKKHYYSTDYVDPDYGGHQGKDATLADFEEEEAKNLQQHLIQQLDDNDFSLDMFVKKDDVVEATQQEVIKADISKLSKRQKTELLCKESPEFFGLVEDFKAKMVLLRDYLHPIIELSKDDKVPKCTALDFVVMHYQTILNYCTNIYMYLLLKSTRTNIQTHPVIKRLFQYRQLLSQLAPVFEEIIKPQIEVIIAQNQNEGTKDVEEKIPKILSKVTQTFKRTRNDETSIPAVRQKRAKMSELNPGFVETVQATTLGEEMSSENVLSENKDVAGEIIDSRREITYQMAKNKGLTPRRKKEQRNPRVKHRNKYRKAKIRRKGAVREVRFENKRYTGELSGIKTSVVKSIKIKS